MDEKQTEAQKESTATAAETVDWAKKLKLNYPRTLLIGLAFFAISLFWQVYDYVLPLVLGDYIHDEFIKNIVMMLDNLFALFMLPLVGMFSDKTRTRFGKRMPYIVIGTIVAAVAFTLVGVGDYIRNLPMIIVCVVICLMAMSAFRSPAVALMPDLTPKPLRSKANAIINITGTIGGILATMVLVNASIGLVNAKKEFHEFHPVTGEVFNDFIYSYDGTSILLYIIVALIMLAAIVALVLTIKENKAKAKVDADAKEKGYVEEEEDKKAAEKEKGAPLAKKRIISLVLILASVFLWFMGYNAVTTAASRYGYIVWGQDVAMALTIAQGAAFLLAIPAGLLGSKIGRKWTIMIGVVIIGGSFLALAFITKAGMIANVLFALVGIGWATINVNSFPMVVELAKGGDVGKYTGIYYFASMGAQTLTPLFSGLLIQNIGWKTLFPYSAIFILLALVTMFFVKHGDSKPGSLTKTEMLEQMESKR